jgi:hypothetical protein
MSFTFAPVSSKCSRPTEPAFEIPEPSSANVVLCHLKKLTDAVSAVFAYIQAMIEFSTPLMKAMFVPGRMRT